MIVAPGLRRFLGRNPLNTSAFFAPLTHSLILTRGTGNPTYTGATAKTLTDFEGLLKQVPSGCARFSGARFVRNFLTFPEDFSNAAWVDTTGGTGTVSHTPNYNAAPDGTTTACRIQATLGSGFGFVRQTMTGLPANRTSVIQVWIKSNTGASQTVNVSDSFKIANTVTVTTSWRLMAVSVAALSGTTSSFDVGAQGASDASIDVSIWHPQYEITTGQTNTNPSEYVSNGVLSAPYHGAGVDGCKFFSTLNPCTVASNVVSGSDSVGAAINSSQAACAGGVTAGVVDATGPLGYNAEGARTNLCLQSNAFTTTWTNSSAAPTQNAIGPDGATSAWTLTDSSAVATAYITQAITLTAAAHTVSLKVKKTTGAQSSYPVILALTGTGSILSGVTVDTSNGVATPWTSFTGYTIASGVSVRCTSQNTSFWQVEMTFTATAASWSFYLEPAGALTPTLATVGTDVSAQGSAVFYGAQVELGSFATPYQRTTTVAVARNANLLTYTGADVANIKTLAATFSRGVGVSNVGVHACLYSDSTHYITSFLNSATDARFIGSDATVQWNTSASNAYVAGATSKMSQTWATNNVLMDKDGTAQIADVSASVPSYTSIGVGHLNGTLIHNGPVNHLYGWTRNLSQSELGAIDR